MLHSFAFSVQFPPPTTTFSLPDIFNITYLQSPILFALVGIYVVFIPLLSLNGVWGENKNEHLFNSPMLKKLTGDFYLMLIHVLYWGASRFCGPGVFSLGPHFKNTKLGMKENVQIFFFY